jgi:hypothetical protein
MATGIYRTKTEESGTEHAYVRYGSSAGLEGVTRAYYEEHGYEPPFEELPTKEEYEAAHAGQS